MRGKRHWKVYPTPKATPQQPRPNDHTVDPYFTDETCSPRIELVSGFSPVTPRREGIYIYSGHSDSQAKGAELCQTRKELFHGGDMLPTVGARCRSHDHRCQSPLGCWESFLPLHTTKLDPTGTPLSVYTTLSTGVARIGGEIKASEPASWACNRPGRYELLSLSPAPPNNQHHLHAGARPAPTHIALVLILNPSS